MPFRKFLLDLIFPNRCPFCGEIIKYNKLSCDTCLEQIEWAEGKVCEICGSNLCMCGSDMHYDICYVSAVYAGAAKEGVISLKKGYGSNFAEITADKLYPCMMRNGEKFDFIIPAPMEKQKRRRKGFNHAEELSKAFGAKFGKDKIKTGVIIKSGGRKAQHTMNAEERAENIKGIYYQSPKDKTDLNGKNILLCDDVITTGATMNECARILKELGASRVAIAAAAVTLKEKAQGGGDVKV